MPDDAKKMPIGRIPLIDLLRGLALVAMTIYHFAWDLEYFGWLISGTIGQPGWVLFARLIAASFLYLVGVSLVLAHGDGIEWRNFKKRFLQVAISAFAISLVTYLAVPGGFIFFGILHAIALFSIIALIFLRLHWIFSALAAGTIFWLGQNFQSEVFNASVFWWLGLATDIPKSNDYVPLFPWLSAVLIGIAFSKIGTATGTWSYFAKLRFPDLVQRPLTYIGQHSLIYYLLHQPIMMGLLFVFTTFSPPDQTTNFQVLCIQSCSETNEATFCQRYCSCMIEDLKTEKLLTPFMQGKVDQGTNQTFRAMIGNCSKN